jgi:hypothetical protein
MKRFLMSTAVVALVPMYALAQDEPAEGGVLKPQDPAAEAQANTVDPMAENAEGSEMAEGEEPELDSEEPEVAEGADTELDTEEPEVAEGADPAMETEEPEVAEEADPMAESDDPALADAADPMTETDTDMAADAGSMGGTLGIQGMVPVSAITGGVVYTTTVDAVDENWEGTASYEAIGDGWERIGSIQDIVLSSEGKIEGIVAEVGGFLGIGDKFVMLPTSDFKLVPIDEDSYAIVTPYTTDQLTDMEEYDSTM